MHIGFPFHIDGHGKVAQADHERHIRDLIEQVLFTSPGERINRPDFGSGVNQLQFSPGSDELVNAIQFLVQAALQRWLGDLIQVDAVQITTALPGQLHIVIQYRVLPTNLPQTVTFHRSL